MNIFIILLVLIIICPANIVFAETQCNQTVNFLFFKNSKFTKDEVLSFLNIVQGSQLLYNMSIDGDEILTEKESSQCEAKYVGDLEKMEFKIFRRVYNINLCNQGMSTNVTSNILIDDSSHNSIDYVSALFAHELFHHLWFYKLTWEQKIKVTIKLADEHPELFERVSDHIDEEVRCLHCFDREIKYANETIAYVIQHIINPLSSSFVCEKEKRGQQCLHEIKKTLSDVISLLQGADKDVISFLTQQLNRGGLPGQQP